MHLHLAEKTKKPVIVHIRSAHREALDILAHFNIKAVLHCFSGEKEHLLRALELGCFIGVGGTITFPKARIRELLKYIPTDRLLLETDAPYLAPIPHRGKQNEPGFIRYTAETVAEILRLSLEEIGRITTQNAKTLFSIE